MLVTNSTKL